MIPDVVGIPSELESVATVMGDNPFKLGNRFRSMWEADSPMQQEWSNFEGTSQGIRDLSRGLSARASAMRHLPDIEAEMKSESREMGQLFLETLVLLWNRLLLRTCLKVADSLEMMFLSMNAANAYCCAIAARSILEHVAFLQYFADDIPWRESQVITHEAMVKFTKRLFNLTQGSTFDWDKMLSGNVSLRSLVASKNWKRPFDERIPSIATLVEALDKKMATRRGSGVEGQFQFLYAAMSDVVHPSWGGEFIYAPHIYRHIKLERAFDENFRRIVTLFCLPTFGVAHHLGKLVAFMMGNEPRMLAIGDND